LTLRSDPRASANETAQRTDAIALRPREFGRWIWRQLVSMRTALVLLFVLAVAAVPGSLIPQQPVDPSAVTAFRVRHPSLSPVFDHIGMFHVYSSVWFSAVYVLLMASLVGCIIPRTRVYAKACKARPPKAPRNLRRFSAYESWYTDEQTEDVSQRAQRVLSAQRRRINVYSVGGETVVSAEKGYLREAGNLLFHCALIVVLIGVAITSLFGFKGAAAVVEGSGFANTVSAYDDFDRGARFKESDLAPFSFVLRRFNMTWVTSGEAAGAPASFDADLDVIDRPGATPRGYDLRVNHPLQVDGTSVFLVGHGYAPLITVRDGWGRVAFSGPVVFLPQDGSFTSFGVVKVPDARPAQLGFEGYLFPTAALDTEGRPYSAFPAANNPVLTLIGYRGNLGLDSGVPQSVYVLDKRQLQSFKLPGGAPRPLLLKVGETAKLAGGLGSITFNGVRPWVRLQISRKPGKIVPLSGVLAAIVGLLGSLFVRPRRTWVRVRRVGVGTSVEVAALDRTPGGNPGRHVRELSESLRSATAVSP
jgi:cytochrome c biogenesis protein